MHKIMKIVIVFLVAVVILPVGGGIASVAKEPETSAYSQTLLAEINAYRAKHGVSRLSFDSKMAQLARNHSVDMSRQQQLSHDGFDNRFANARSHRCVENVGWNYPSPVKQFNAWRQSSGHNENMLTAGLHKAGISEIGGYVTFFACQ